MLARLQGLQGRGQTGVAEVPLRDETTYDFGPGEKGMAVPELKTFGLFVATAIAEIVGCYLPYLWLTRGASVLVLLPAAGSLVLFVWLLSLHPTAAGRVYAAYGGVYVATAVVWLFVVDGVRPTVWDLVGALVAIGGMAIIMFAPRPA
jgi:small multidrug resistance family-3 protein